MEISVMKLESCVKQDPDEDFFESDGFESESMIYFNQNEKYNESSDTDIQEEEDPLKITIEPETKKFQCSLCTNVYSYKNGLNEHIRRKHREKQLIVQRPRPQTECGCSCPIGSCDLSFSTKQNCVVHISNTHAINQNSDNDQEGKLHCPLCSKYFSMVQTLHYHINSVHASDEKKHFECQICKDEQKCSKFFDQVCLNKHINFIHKPFKCEVCFLSFDSSNFKRHKDSHLGGRKFQCDYCPKTFSQKATLKFHLIEKHQDHTVNMKISKCELCERIFCSSKRLKSHMAHAHVVEVDTTLPCNTDICSRRFRDESDLAHHLSTTKSHTKRRLPRYVCIVCSQRFKSKINYDRHLGVEHGIFFDCRKCSLLFKTKGDFDEHLKISSDSPELQCQICFISLKNQCSLAIHEESHVKELQQKVKAKLENKDEKSDLDELHAELETQFKCDVCPKTFSTSSYLSLHRRKDHENLKWQCKSCGKKFDQRYKLVRHERIHSKVRPFVSKNVCDLCPNIHFSTELELKLHRVNYHPEEKPFACQFCPQVFRFKSQLDDHSVAHTNQRPFGCDECSSSFKSRRYLCEHQRRVHRPKKLKTCRICSFQTNDLMEIETHSNMHHLPKVSLWKSCSRWP